jgi:hypothetical protein
MLARTLPFAITKGKKRAALERGFAAKGALTSQQFLKVIFHLWLEARGKCSI